MKPSFYRNMRLWSSLNLLEEPKICLHIYPTCLPACLSAMPSVGTVELQKLNRRDSGAKRLGRIAGWDRGRGKTREGGEQKVEQ